MHSHLTPEYGLWLEPLLVLLTGAAAIVALSGLAERFVKTGAWRRTIWQAATLGLLALLVAEVTGMGTALLRLARVGTTASAAETAAPVAALEAQGLDAADGTPAARVFVETTGVGGTDEAFWGRLGSVPLAEQRIASARLDEYYGRVREAGDGQPHVPASPMSGVVPPNSEQHPGQGLGYHADGHVAGPASGASRRRQNSPVVESLLSAPDPASDVQSVPAWEARPGYAWWPGVVWLVGAAGIAMQIARGHLLLLVFRRRHDAGGDRRLSERAHALALQLGIRRPVAVLEAAGLTAPVAFGRWRPTLVLPVAFARDFDRRQQEAMLAHELAHLAAADPAWQLLSDVVCALLWWHPLSWWSRRRLRGASETAADEASLLVPDGPDVLASCLIVLGRRLVSRPPARLGWLSVEGPRFRSNLGRRVDRLLRFPRRSWRPPGGGRLALARSILPVVLAIMAVLGTAWARPQAALARGGTTMNLVARSWRQSLAAAALVAVFGPFSDDAVSRAQEGHEAIRVEIGEREVAAERERGQREAREGERRDRPEASRREGERRDRPEASQREGERRDRPEARERERPGRSPERDALVREVETLRLSLPALREGGKENAVEVVEAAIRAREVTLEGRRDDEAAMVRERSPNRSQLADVLSMAAGLWRERGDQEKAGAIARLAGEFARGDREVERPAPDRERREGEPWRRDVGQPDRPRGERIPRELIAKRRELMERMAQIQRELAGLRDDQDEEARRLRAALREVQEQLRRLQPDRPGPTPFPGGPIRDRLAELGRALAGAREAGRAEEVERIRREIAERVTDFRPRGRPLPPAPIPPGVREQIESLEGTVRDLRAEVRQLRDQMEDIRRMLRSMQPREGRGEAREPERREARGEAREPERREEAREPARRERREEAREPERREGRGEAREPERRERREEAREPERREGRAEPRQRERGQQ